MIYFYLLQFDFCEIYTNIMDIFLVNVTLRYIYITYLYNCTYAKCVLETRCINCIAKMVSFKIKLLFKTSILKLSLKLLSHGLTWRFTIFVYSRVYVIPRCIHLLNQKLKRIYRDNLRQVALDLLKLETTRPPLSYTRCCVKAVLVKAHFFSTLSLSISLKGVLAVGMYVPGEN